MHLRRNKQYHDLYAGPDFIMCLLTEHWPFSLRHDWTYSSEWELPRVTTTAPYPGRAVSSLTYTDAEASNSCPVHILELSRLLIVLLATLPTLAE